MTVVQSRNVVINGLHTHFLEAGSGPSVVLLHGADFGTDAAICWEETVSALADEFHVVAPDLLGYGASAKVFSFDDQRRLRLEHAAALTRHLDVGPTWLIGNSAGATMSLELAADPTHGVDVAGVICVAGGGPNKDNAARATLNAFDGTRAGLAAILRELFLDDSFTTGDYFERRYEAALVPGVYEVFCATRLPPLAERQQAARRQPDFTAIKAPTLLVGGADDRLKPIGELRALAPLIAGAEVVEIPGARHYPQVEQASLFQTVVLGFIRGTR